MAAPHSLRAENGPLRLVPTPHSTSGQDDAFTQSASLMALVHNVFIRSFNSIYLQAPMVKAEDVPDFLCYCRVWHNMVHEHHDSEEAVLFPSIEEATGVKGVMDEDVAEHKAFHGGLEQFKACVDDWSAEPSNYSSVKLVALLDSLGPVLETHLAHEPRRLAELSRYPIDMKAIADKLEKHSMSTTSPTDTLPMLWFNLDRDFEGGRWATFPQLAAPVKWVMINVVGWWHKNWWRFGSCGPDGVQRDLLCLTAQYRQ